MKKIYKHKVTKLDKYIIQKMIMFRKDNNISVTCLAEILNVSDSFIKNVEAYNNRYNLYHLFLISSHFSEKISLSNFFPSQETFNQVHGFEKYSSFEELKSEIIIELREKKEKKNEG